MFSQKFIQRISQLKLALVSGLILKTQKSSSLPRGLLTSWIFVNDQWTWMTEVSIPSVSASYNKGKRCGVLELKIRPIIPQKNLSPNLILFSGLLVHKEWEKAFGSCQEVTKVVKIFPLFDWSLADDWKKNSRVGYVTHGLQPNKKNRSTMVVAEGGRLDLKLKKNILNERLMVRAQVIGLSGPEDIKPLENSRKKNQKISPAAHDNPFFRSVADSVAPAFDKSSSQRSLSHTAPPYRNSGNCCSFECNCCPTEHRQRNP